MASSDLRIVRFSIALSEETYRIPFTLSSGTITSITYAKVTVEAENRSNARAKGYGDVLLSVLWSFPDPALSYDAKDRAMRLLLEKIGEFIVSVGEFLDPLQLAEMTDRELERLMGETEKELNFPVAIPRLCGIVCGSAFDAAIHDAWAAACGLSAYRMYNADYLNEDLSRYLGAGWAGKYPQQFLVPPRKQLSVQHVIGGLDPLTSGDAGFESGLVAGDWPVTLEQWIVKEGLRWFKVKLKGSDAAWDFQRIVDVYEVAASVMNRRSGEMRVNLSLDPNEACATPEPIMETLLKLKVDYPEVFAAVRYVEQPTPRDLDSYNFTLHELARIKPVIVDESLDHIGKLNQVEEQGWSGIALKTGRGHSQSLLAYCWAKQNRRYLTMQDLTNPGRALIHSANLCSHLAMDIEAFEHNSRQYIPHSGETALHEYPGIQWVREGRINLSEVKHLGLY